ncbi:hypothetical protein M514_00098 [Trichuris suis]|uniref:Uncharacterized protein n=1 Tax=Trichuris suis TaxID=68888 RepID=A0A085NU18_9BILA|nr:hypothetical protein M513_00098 [Trichuris suis]KFD72964.1 hypothetical protein M514_00098 [Trichuris suis]
MPPAILFQIYLSAAEDTAPYKGLAKDRTVLSNGRHSRFSARRGMRERVILRMATEHEPHEESAGNGRV